MRRALFVLLSVCAPMLAHAQGVATLTSKLAWDQPAQDVAAASAYVYKATIDTLPAVVLSGVTCAAPVPPATDFPCQGNFPAATPGTHTVSLITEDPSTTPPLDSVPSVSLAFTMRLNPAPPRNLRTRD